MFILPSWVIGSLELLTTLFVFAVGLSVLTIIVLFIIDFTQTRDAVRKNYPVLGRFRYLFTTLGEFFRQYFLVLIVKNLIWRDLFLISLE